MNALSGKRAANLSYIAALFCIGLLSMGGFAEHVLFLSVSAILWVVLGMGMARRWRLAAYLAFLLSLVSLIVLVGATLSHATAIPSWAYLANAAVNLVIGASCFVVLWKPKPQRESASILG